MFKYIFSILLLPLTLAGQGIVLEQPPYKPDYLPSALRVGVDVFSLGNTLFVPGKNKYELQGDIDFHKFFFNLDLGLEENTRNNTNFDYFNSGTYFRAGFDYDLMPYNAERSTIFLGLRYAATTFQQEMTFYQTDSVRYDIDAVRVTDRGMSARWIELVSGMKVRVYQGFFLGYTARYKIYKRINGSNAQDIYDLPGYGLARKNTNLDFSFYVYYRLAFRYKAVPPKPDK